MVTVITVVRNDASHISQTLESVLTQQGVTIEYLILDGASTDGTPDIIRKTLSAHPAPSNVSITFTSSPDAGMYDALNRGILKAEGGWISVINSGDVYTSANALSKALSMASPEADVIFGHSIEVHQVWNQEIRALSDISLLRFAPTFRHGSSLIRTPIHKQHLFDLSLRSRLGYALDWEMLHRLWLEGYRFECVDTFIESYLAEGMSNHPFRNLLYNYRITTSRSRNCPASVSEGLMPRQPATHMQAIRRMLKDGLYLTLKRSSLYRYMRAIILDYMVNDILPHIPFWSWRRWYLRRLGMQIGKGSFIMKRNYFINANLVRIGNHSHINTQCIIDARGGITIGSSVSISHRVCLMTGSHDYMSPNFQGIFKPIVIEDYAWIGVGATLLQGITIGQGAVVCAGAVVTHDVAPYTVVAGIPARLISTRPTELNYHCQWDEPLT